MTPNSHDIKVESKESESTHTARLTESPLSPALNPGSPDRARGLASFVESLFNGTRLRHAGVPTKNTSIGEIDEEPPELLDLLLDSPDAIVLVEREQGRIIEASHKFVEWTGISHQDVIHRKLLDLFAEPERKAARTLYEDAGAGGVHVIELLSVEQGARARLIEFTSSRSRSAQGAFAIIMGRDVGERAATERYLRAERDRLNTFIRSMRDSLILISPAGDILYANPACDQNFEAFQLPTVCHRWLTEFATHDSADLQGLASAYEGQTLELESGDGRIFLVTRSFLFEYGKKATAMLMAKDITEQRLVERQNHQLEIELMRESKLAEFGMLAAGIAHNMNGPLTGIMGFCDLLKMTHPELKEIDHIQSQAVALKSITSNLMHKSRNEQETKPQDLNIEDIILTELSFLEANLFYKHQIKKTVELDQDSPPLRGIYIDFSQVIGNLLRNAIDAMYGSERRELTVKTSSTSEYVSISIGDTGTGMTEEVKQKLFTPFFTTKPKVQDAEPGEPTGTGLGLSTSRGILARYGAEIEVDSAPGQGSTFTIRFPLNRKSIG